jgi:hypothetical protein
MSPKEHTISNQAGPSSLRTTGQNTTSAEPSTLAVPLPASPAPTEIWTPSAPPSPTTPTNHVMLPNQLWEDSPAPPTQAFGMVFNPRTFVMQVSAAAGGNDFTFSLTAQNMQMLGDRVIQAVTRANTDGDFSMVLTKNIRFAM